MARAAIALTLEPILQDAGVEIREEVCVTVDVGSSRSISKAASVDPAYYCPDRVSKDEWLGGAEYDDTYGVEQKGGDLTVTRTDDADAHGWGMDLQIEVRPPAACGAHRPTR